jgi:hypothetical protein
MNVNLVDFLTKGIFGHLHQGLSRWQVMERLGIPCDWPGKGKNSPMLQSYAYGYAAFDLFFDGDTLSCITVFAHTDWNEANIHWTDAAPLCSTKEQIKEFLVIRGIRFEEGTDRKNLPNNALKTEGGVRFCFTQRLIEMIELPTGGWESVRESEYTLSTLVLNSNG